MMYERKRKCTGDLGNIYDGTFVPIGKCLHARWYSFKSVQYAGIGCAAFIMNLLGQ